MTRSDSFSQCNGTFSNTCAAAIEDRWDAQTGLPSKQWETGNHFANGWQRFGLLRKLAETGTPAMRARGRKLLRRMVRLKQRARPGSLGLG
jgi:hypothetical protein